MSESRLVYSTASNSTCPRCHKPLKNCRCQPASKQSVPTDGIIRISRETKGRKGKGVTLISGVQLKEAELKQLAKQLKTVCGSGGSIKQGVIEIQGDHRQQVKALLENQLKQTVKLAGG